MKAILNPDISVKNPYKGGMNAPPAIAVHSIPEPCGFNSPKSSIAKLNMVGNIMELKRPTARIDHIETNPFVDMLIKIKNIARELKTTRTELGRYTRVK